MVEAAQVQHEGRNMTHKEKLDALYLVLVELKKMGNMFDEASPQEIGEAIERADCVDRDFFRRALGASTVVGHGNA